MAENFPKNRLHIEKEDDTLYFSFADQVHNLDHMIELNKNEVGEKISTVFYQTETSGNCIILVNRRLIFVSIKKDLEGCDKRKVQVYEKYLYNEAHDPTLYELRRAMNSKAKNVMRFFYDMRYDEFFLFFLNKIFIIGTYDSSMHVTPSTVSTNSAIRRINHRSVLYNPSRVSKGEDYFVRVIDEDMVKMEGLHRTNIGRVEINREYEDELITQIRVRIKGHRPKFEAIYSFGTFVSSEYGDYHYLILNNGKVHEIEGNPFKCGVIPHGDGFVFETTKKAYFVNPRGKLFELDLIYSKTSEYQFIDYEKNLITIYKLTVTKGGKKDDE